MTIRHNTRMYVQIRYTALVVTLLTAFCSLTGCDKPSAKKEVPQVRGASTVDILREVVAKRLKKSPGQIDISKPLVTQGMDELGVVEIVMDAEQALNVALPDKGVSDHKAVTVQMLADLFAKQKK